MLSLQLRKVCFPSASRRQSLRLLLLHRRRLSLSPSQSLNHVRLLLPPNQPHA